MNVSTAKQQLKQVVMAYPGLWARYVGIKMQLRRLAKLRYFLYDIGGTYRAMHWRADDVDLRPLSAALLFQYHKLEKGLVMPGPRRMFGAEPAREIVRLLRRWRSAGSSAADPVYLGALETLHAYADHMRLHGLDPAGAVLPWVSEFLAETAERAPELETPALLPRPDSGSGPDLEQAFASLALQRRSVRRFLPMEVPGERLQHAVSLAALSPSACNRQPCRVHVVSDPQRKKQLLSQQNGNRGFGHLAPHILVITADERGFFDASERHQPYIDGGLFAMSLAYALSSQSIASCLLNWCVPPANDRAVHALLDLHHAERIVMFMAIGYAPPDCPVPRSPRRDLSSILVYDAVVPAPAPTSPAPATSASTPPLSP